MGSVGHRISSGGEKDSAEAANRQEHNSTPVFFQHFDFHNRFYYMEVSVVRAEAQLLDLQRELQHSLQMALFSSTHPVSQKCDSEPS